MVTCGPVPGAGGRTPGSQPKDRDPGLPDADWSNDATGNPVVDGRGGLGAHGDSLDG